MSRALLALSLEDVLIAGLDPLTHRDLKLNPPKADETMQAVGVSKTNLDTVVRSWVNRQFRVPNHKPLLAQGAIKLSTKWQAFVELCK